jgi:hypothetical protein
MTSQINYAAITTNYPVAGQDNDSQGFRDNFTAISAGLATAKNEITGLQSNAVLVADLNAGTALVNNLQGSTLSNGLFSQFYGVYFNGGSVSSSANIDLTNGPIQKFTLTGNATLTFTNWPATGTWGVARVMIACDQNAVRYPTFSTANAGQIKYDVAYPTNPATSTPGFTIGGEGVASITVNNAGTGFATPTTISFTGGSPQTGAITPQATATYQIVSANVNAGGTGFVIGDVLVANALSIISVTVTGVSAGIITSVSLTTTGPLTAPVAGVRNFTAVTGSGSGAKFTLVSGIAAITVTNPGNGYTTVAPTVVFSNGSSASATANLTILTADNIKVIEAWTVDGGATVLLRYIGEY